MGRSNINLVGNTTTGSNLGSGACVFAGKNTGNNLQFRTISATGTSIQIFQRDNDILISGATGGGGTSGIGWSNLANGSTVAGCGTVASGSTITRNTFYGVDAGKSITTGCNNVAVGFHALCKNTEGSNNIAIGYCALCGDRKSVV